MKVRTPTLLIPALTFGVGVMVGVAGQAARVRRVRAALNDEAERDYRNFLRVAVRLVDRVLIDGDADAYAPLCRSAARSAATS